MIDTFGLERFVDAQGPVYPAVLREIRRGNKQGHWMWFVFPQVAGLGNSETARRFAIRSGDEAAAYLAHPVLGVRYRQCVEALQDLPATSAAVVFGAVDAMKLRSSLTLFAAVSRQPLFEAAIERWFGGEKDMATVQRLDCAELLAD